MHWSLCTTSKQKSIWSFRNFLPRDTFFTKEVAVAHRNTVILHLIYLKFAFAPVRIAWSGRLFLHKRNMTCVSELKFSCNHNYVATILKIDYRTFQNLLDLGLECCYGLFKLQRIPLQTEKVRNIVGIIDFNRSWFFLRCF